MRIRRTKTPRIGAWRKTAKGFRVWRGFGRLVPWFQGLYYLLGGLWPLLSLDTFMQVTGPKTDIWLVHIVGLLLTVSGAVLLLSAVRRRVDLETALLAAGYAAALAGAEIMYLLKGTLPPIYLLDTLFEAAFILGWILNGKSKPAATRPPPR
jgi:hypothetical protein